MIYAEIAVDVPVRKTFDYHLPPELEGVVQPGHLVQVEFGTARQNGVVLALLDSPREPDIQTKPIAALLDSRPVVSAAQIDLARWLSERYLASVAGCLHPMYPAGTTGGRDVQVTLMDAAFEGETRAQIRVLNLLRRRGNVLREGQLQRSLSHTKGWRKALDELDMQDVIERDNVITPPRVKPKTVRTAALAIHPAQVEKNLSQLGRQSRRAELLETIAALPSLYPDANTALEVAGTTRQVLNTIAEAGYVTLHEGGRYYELTSEGRDALKDQLDDLTDAQLDALAMVEEAGGALGAGALSSHMQRVLTEKGLLTRTDHPTTVMLNVKDADLDALLLDLREGHKDLRILRVLSEDANAMNVAEVYRRAECSLDDLRRLADRDLVVLGEAEQWRDSLADKDAPVVDPPTLSDEQEGAWAAMRERVEHGTGHHTYLLHGVTGSGKTEVYLRAMETILEQGRQVIFLVPEISITPQTVRRVLARFPNRVAVWHSALGAGERYDTWRRVREGQVDIVVGARSALYAPFPDVGLILVDEEHDASYKQSPPVDIPPYRAAPFYDARAVAEEIVQRTGGTLILGSATPAVETFYRAKRDEIHYLHLPQRIMGHRERILSQARQEGIDVRYHPADDAPDAMAIELPPVDVVDMRNELRAGNRSMFSRRLRGALRQTLNRKEQAILLLNRRGANTYVFCRDCGYVVGCPNCSTTLTYHQYEDALRCHHCNHEQPPPTKCPECRSSKIRFFGAGTQEVENELRRTFPGARVVRWDADTASKPDMHESILRKFHDRQADIMVGTQMVAKGLDLPWVTLVGVVSADTGLALPDFRAGERTFQLLTQVAGRAGRGLLGGQVVLQTYFPQGYEYVIASAQFHDYAAFYAHEIEKRREMHYPPLRRMVRVLFSDTREADAREEASRAGERIRRKIVELDLTGTQMIGPAPCFFTRLKKHYRWHILLYGPDPTVALRDLTFGSNWYVDVDPAEVL